VTSLNREDFFSYLGSELGILTSQLDEATALVDDLGFDSVQVLELIVVIEELGLEISEDWFPAIVTMGDAYTTYQRLLADSAARPDGSSFEESHT
jgi:acyl carrier protein